MGFSQSIPKFASVVEQDTHGNPPLKSIYSSLQEEKKRVNFPHEMTNTACCERGTNILYLKGDSGSSLSFPYPIYRILVKSCRKKCELMKVEKDECNLIPQVRSGPSRNIYRFPSIAQS